MNRALPLLIIAAAAAGGLGYLALETGGRGPGSTHVDPGPGTPDRTARTTNDTSAEIDLAAVPRERTIEATTGGIAHSWEIIPMNLVGQPIATARITATQGSEVRKAEGRTKWESVPSGPWTVVIEAEGKPTWRREVALVPDSSRTKTVARLGDEIWIEGTLTDTNGDRLDRTAVFLLPKGVHHPELLHMRRDKARPRGQAVAGNGAVTAEIVNGGRFRAKLPKDGDWRVSVGAPGAARWTQPRPTAMTYGGPDQAEVTVPALARIRFEFGGAAEERPIQVSAYRFDAEYARNLAETQQGRMDDGSEMTVEQAQKSAKQRALAEKKKLSGLGYGGEGGEGGDNAGRGTARTAREEMAESVVGVGEGDLKASRYQAGRNQLFEPGWRMVKTARVDAQGMAELADIPANIDMRFLFVRGQERIVTAASYKVLEGRLSLARTTLPPPGTSPERGPDNRASVTMTLAPEDDEEKPAPGIVWGY